MLSRTRFMRRAAGARALHRAAMQQLASITDKVITIDLFKDMPQAIVAPTHTDRRVTAFAPHETSSVLLGDLERHQYQLITVSEFANGAAAHDTLRQAPAAPASSSHTTIFATVSPAFANLPFLKVGDVPPPLPPNACQAARQASDVPFVVEADAHVESWQALLSDPAAPMLAFNLLRTPNPEAYAAYSKHFAPLPERYGMRFISAGALNPDPMLSVLRGEPPADVGSNNLMALVYFPSTSSFLHAWSDPEFLQGAYPLRTAMLADGFRHLWLRCHEVEVSRYRTR